MIYIYNSCSFKGNINNKFINYFWKIQKSSSNEILSQFLIDLYFNSNDENCFESLFSHCLEGNWHIASFELLSHVCQIFREWQNLPLFSIRLQYEVNSTEKETSFVDFPKVVSKNGLYFYVSKHFQDDIPINSFLLLIDGKDISSENIINLENSKSIQFDLLHQTQRKQTQYNFSFVSNLLPKYIQNLDQDEVFTPFLFDILSTFFNEKQIFLNQEFHISSFF